MSFKAAKDEFVRLIAFAICVCAFTISFMFIYRLIPRAVSYSISAEQNTAEMLVNSPQYIPDSQGLISDISKIESDGPFTLRVHGDGIYVYEDLECIYKVKAYLSDFPLDDRSFIEKGIEAPDKGTLCEIVSYMES